MDAGDKIQERYRLEAPLGQGGMAEVWCATDHRLKRNVAIKFMAPRLTEDPEFLVRFFAEAQDVARISHPNVVKVLDFGQHSESPYLVMEYVPGGALTDLTGSPVEAEEAFRLIAAAARGAGAAHDAGIVHRDLKPANILLDEDGDPKLADFGIAASTRFERLTATGAAIGSPHYISPEQALGAHASAASDVYSLGIVLYELLTGRRPFEGENITAVAIAQVEQKPTPPSEIIPDLDPAADAVVLKCLAKDPEERFADGNELANILSRSTGPLAVLEEMVGPLAAATGWTRRRTLLAVALALALVAALAVGVLGGADGAPPAVADDGYETKDNVGGLRSKRTRSPSPEDDDRGTVESSPSPTALEARPSRAPIPEETETRRKRREPSPDPIPSDEPSPQPSEEQTPGP